MYRQVCYHSKFSELKYGWIFYHFKFSECEFGWICCYSVHTFVVDKKIHPPSITFLPEPDLIVPDCGIPIGQQLCKIIIYYEYLMSDHVTGYNL